MKRNLIILTWIFILWGCSTTPEPVLLPPTATFTPAPTSSPIPSPTPTITPTATPEPLVRLVPEGELPCTFYDSYPQLPPGQYIAYDTRNDGCYAGECQQTNVFSLDEKKIWPLVRGVACIPEAHAFSADGHLMAFSDQTTGDFQLYLHDFTTNATRKFVSMRGCSGPALSPDGTKIAVSCAEKLRVISVADGSDLLQTGVSISAALKSAWSPDGSKLAYLGYQDYMSGGIGILDANTFSSIGGFRHNNHDFARNFYFVWSPDSQKIGFIFLNLSGETMVHELRVHNLNGKIIQTYPLKVVPTIGEMQRQMVWLDDGRFIFGKEDFIFALSPDGTIRKLLEDAAILTGWTVPAK